MYPCKDTKQIREMQIFNQKNRNALSFMSCCRAMCRIGFSPHSSQRFLLAKLHLGCTHSAPILMPYSRVWHQYGISMASPWVEPAIWYVSAWWQHMIVGILFTALALVLFRMSA